MKLFGVRIRVHPTFFWLLLFLALVTGGQILPWLLVVFAFVVLHELSHCLVAKAHGIRVYDITLLPIGGVARMDVMPEDSATEFKIAIAGPLFNFVMVAISYVLLAALGPDAGRSTALTMLVSLLGMVLLANMVLGVFNLLPAFPMDGGRVLRAYLATKMGYLDATHVAARVGRWVAGAMVVAVLAALVNDRIPVSPWLLLVAAFIYISGKQEEMAVAVRHAERNFWRFFGFGEPGSPAGGQHTEQHDGGPAGPRDRGDVIDIEGEVQTKDDDSAADAFRQLSEDIESRLKQ